MKKIYIAGKINGLDNYKEIFQKAEDELKKEGYVCMNPATLPEGFNYETYMPICISMLEACENVFMLSNWKDSKGAKVEHEYAKAQGKNIIYQEEEDKKKTKISRYIPELEQKYFYPSLTRNTIRNRKFTASPDDFEVMNRGRIFKLEKECFEFGDYDYFNDELNRKIRDYAEENDLIADKKVFDKANKNKFFIVYSYIEEKVKYDLTFYPGRFSTTIKTILKDKEAALKVISKFGEDIKRLYEMEADIYYR